MSGFSLRNLMPYLVDLGDELVNSDVFFKDIERVLGTPDGRQEIVNAIIRSNTAQWEREIEEAIKGNPLSAEELQAAEPRLSYQLFRSSHPLDLTWKRNLIHLRPECYNELPRQYRVIFRLYFLHYLRDEDIANRLQLEYDHTPQPEYGADEWTPNTVHAVQELLLEMTNAVREKIRDIYQRDREILLEQQKQDAITHGCRVKIDEITEGIVPGVRRTLNEMDITHLAELQRVTERDFRSGSYPSVNKPSMAKFAKVMRQHGVAFMPEPDNSFY